MMQRKTPAMDDLNSFRRDLLYVIAGLDGPTGVAIKVVEKGFVNKGRQDGRTHAYRLTDRGQRELEARREWEAKYVMFRE